MPASRAPHPIALATMLALSVATPGASAASPTTVCSAVVNCATGSISSATPVCDNLSQSCNVKVTLTLSASGVEACGHDDDSLGQSLDYPCIAGNGNPVSQTWTVNFKQTCGSQQVFVSGSITATTAGTLPQKADLPPESILIPGLSCIPFSAQVGPVFVSFPNDVVDDATDAATGLVPFDGIGQGTVMEALSGTLP